MRINPPPGNPTPGQPADHDRAPLPVWATAQQLASRQRAGRYLPDSTAHSAKMLTATARHAISAYTHPGDLVLDPMCGVGTTLVEAVHLGRDAVGIELEPRWASLARKNLDHAHRQGATGAGRVHQGDACRLAVPGLRGQVTMVLTSPPYGSSRHGQVRARPGAGVTKWDDTYATSPHTTAANLAHAADRRLLEALEAILTACRAMLRPGGLVVLTARPWRRHDALVDFPGAVARVGETAGLVLVERNVALLCGLRDSTLVPRRRFPARPCPKIPPTAIQKRQLKAAAISALASCRASARNPPLADLQGNRMVEIRYVSQGVEVVQHADNLHRGLNLATQIILDHPDGVRVNVDGYEVGLGKDLVQPNEVIVRPTPWARHHDLGHPWSEPIPPDPSPVGFIQSSTVGDLQHLLAPVHPNTKVYLACRYPQPRQSGFDEKLPLIEDDTTGGASIFLCEGGVIDGLPDSVSDILGW